MKAGVIFPKKSGILWNLVQIQGSDARDFLERLSSIQIHPEALQNTGQGICFLTDRGKFEFYGLIHASGPNRFLLQFADNPESSWQGRLFEYLDKFHFGEDISWNRLDWEPLWVFGPSPDREGLNQAEEILANPDYPFGPAWISIWAKDSSFLKNFAQNKTALEQTDMDLAQIKNLGAWPDREITPDRNPLELGLTQAISDQKGCYPGQEVIEKIKALGEPAKRLVQIQLENSSQAIPAQAEVTDPDGKLIGTVTSCQGSTALLIASKRLAKKDQSLHVVIDSTPCPATIREVAAFK